MREEELPTMRRSAPDRHERYARSSVDLYESAESKPKAKAKTTLRVGTHSRVGSAPETTLAVPMEAEGSGASTDATDKAVLDKLANPTDAGL